ncbi:hypothetical protein MATL_G00115290 [Megalops atlanticus]|uniref:Protein NPAT C-terminal domain-containing protein n=1 Tax=Megalops atlanticus TaxID=7932 RepID=A0A9D3PYU3_MEGAT|nr:hypothetical protein MATL_G00115290 [Megalops atlanticus]
MLLPSDIARLVLGYLQQAGLRATSQAFILESPDLKEYAEHSTDDGATCVFSLFGKNLTTILTEYATAKAKETRQETQIPAMVTSLWKKLDFTLNQIKCLQNSPVLCQNQICKWNGFSDTRHQRALSSTQSPISMSRPQGMLGIATPVCRSYQHTRPAPHSVGQPLTQEENHVTVSVNRDPAFCIVAPDHRVNFSPLSPGCRKCDSCRIGGGSTHTSFRTESSPAEPGVPAADRWGGHRQGDVTDGFPQVVIEAAREKILNEKSLQEKLAENIHRILGSDIPQSSKHRACSPVEQNQSSKEMLDLQGAQCMTEDAVQDILEQTEADPAFHALVNTVDYDAAVEGSGAETTCGKSESAKPRNVPGPRLCARRAADTSAPTCPVKDPQRDAEQSSRTQPRNTPSYGPVSEAPPTSQEANSEDVSSSTAAHVVMATPTLSGEPDPDEVISLTVISYKPSSDLVPPQVVSGTEEAPPTITPAAPTAAAAGCVTPEETAEAVSYLQRSEVMQAGSEAESDQEAVLRAAIPAMGEIQPLFLSGSGKATSPKGSGNNYCMTVPATAGQKQPASPALSQASPGQKSTLSCVLETLPSSGPANSMAQFVSMAQLVSHSCGVPTDSNRARSPLHTSHVQSMQRNMVPLTPTAENNTEKVPVVPSQILTLPAAARSQTKSKPQPRPVLKHTTGTVKMGTCVSDLTTKAGNSKLRPAVTPPEQPKAPVFMTAKHTPDLDPTNQRRMLCFEVSGTNTVQVSGSARRALSPSEEPIISSSPIWPTQREKLIGQDTGSTTFVWVKPPITASSMALHSAEVERCTGKPETSDTTEPAGKTAKSQSSREEGRHPFSSDAEDQRVRAQSSSGRRATTQLHAAREKTQRADKNEYSGLRGGAKDVENTKTSDLDQALRSKVSNGRDADKRSSVGQEGRAEITSPPGTHHATVNKESKLEGRSWRERVIVTPTQPGDSPVSSSVQKASCKTSPLTKLAAKILQVARCPTSASPEVLPLPRTPESGRPPEEQLDCQDSPAQNGEATPRQPSQTATPDAPACSPASEAGSESSVSMAARTLIILSRATPLRDGSQQRAPHAKATKRKHTQPLTTPAARKQLQLSASMRKAKKRKQQLDSLPNDLDVDKFLSSLHYDE